MDMFPPRPPLYISVLVDLWFGVEAKPWGFGALAAWLEKREQHTARRSLPHAMSFSRKEDPRWQARNMTSGKISGCD